LKTKKNFQIRTFRSRKKQQHGREELKQRNNKTNNMNKNDSLSLVQGPSTVTCMIAT
jgi:hypothetical protein